MFSCVCCFVVLALGVWSVAIFACLYFVIWFVTCLCYFGICYFIFVLFVVCLFASCLFVCRMFFVVCCLLFVC